MISNLREMYVYESLHNHVVIPYRKQENGDLWMCRVFYYSNALNEVLDQGIYQYDNNGVCIDDDSKLKNVVKQTATQNLHPKLRAAVKEWKQRFKGENK